TRRRDPHACERGVIRIVLLKCAAGGDPMIHESSSSLSAASIDDLAYTAVFSADEATRSEARRQIHQRARKAGAVPASISPLYQAIGRGDVTRRFTVPAFNIRALTYYVARSLFRTA